MPFSRFRLAAPEAPSPSPSLSSSFPSPPSHPQDDPGPTQLVWRAFDDPKPKPQPGTFAADSVDPEFNIRWSSWDEFVGWLEELEEQNGLQFVLAQTDTGQPAFVEKMRYVCSRGATGGRKPDYVRKKPGWGRKIPRKFVDCQAALIVKEYPDTPTILGKYSDKHNHDVGNHNLPFVAIPRAVREYIAAMFRNKVDAKEVLRLVHRGAYDDDNLFDADLDGSQVARRSDFVQLSDIRRIQKDIKAESVRKSPDDAKSTLLWIAEQQEQGRVLYFKAKSDAPPPGSNLAADAFVLIIQSAWQRRMLEQYGPQMLFLDATHNVTMYENLNLTTLMVRDAWGHGLPTAWMLANYATEATFEFYLRFIFYYTPIVPQYIMTDFDTAQINACRTLFPYAVILLCWWHVLHAWQQHFHIPTYPQLWVLLKDWIRVRTPHEWYTTWEKIQNIAPPTFIEYLNTYWLPDVVVRMWSAVYRTEFSVWQNSNTNMLLEAWHHVLKSKFLEGLRNRRLDHLLYTLIRHVLPYYALIHRRRELGFDGLDLESKKRTEIFKASRSIPIDDILALDDLHFHVRSQSNRELTYAIDMEVYACTCPDFPLINSCKHLCAVSTFFDRYLPAAHASYPEVPSIVELSSIVDNPLDNLPLIIAPPKGKAKEIPAHILVAEKAERVAAVLRLSASGIPSLGALDACLNDILADTQGTQILPATQKIAPNQTTGAEFRAVFPAVKKKKAKAGDAAYGAGKTSGLKAKRAVSKKQPNANSAQAVVARDAQESAVVVVSDWQSNSNYAQVW